MQPADRSTVTACPRPALVRPDRQIGPVAQAASIAPAAGRRRPSRWPMRPGPLPRAARTARRPRARPHCWPARSRAPALARPSNSRISCSALSRGVADLDASTRSGGSSPKSSGCQTRASHPACLDHPDRGRSVERHLVESVAAGDDHGPANVLLPREDLCQQLRLALVGNADELVGGTGGIAERADQVEERSERELTSHRREP